jgi:two-component system OmpR family sensor kinase
MKNYSFFFDDDRFDIDIVPNDKKSKLYELYFDEKSLYILTPLSEKSEDLLKVFYPKQKYDNLLNLIKKTILFQFLFLSFIASIISLVFSFYTLSPLRNSLKLLEEFIKDIIHDLNTPITSILINLKMMDNKNEEVASIAQSAKTISMLHKNLDGYLKEREFEIGRFRVDDVIEEQIKFFSSMYDYLSWEVDTDSLVIESDKNAFTRIIYNLLSNACKYNTTNGFVSVKLKENILSISNSSYGIKNPDKIFDRFYKESDRGVGIGLHIVKKLCNELGIERELKVENNIVTIYLLLPQ